MRRHFTVLILFVAALALSAPCVFAGGKKADGQAVLKELQDYLSRKHATYAYDRVMTDLVAELAKLKYAPAKRAVYHEGGKGG